MNFASGLTVSILTDAASLNVLLTSASSVLRKYKPAVVVVLIYVENLLAFDTQDAASFRTAL